MCADSDEGTSHGVSRVVLVRTGPEAEVDVRGEVDIATTPQFDEAVRLALEEGASVLVMRLEGVTFMGSSGLAGLLRAQRLMREAGGRLVIAEPSPAVTDLLDMTKLQDRFGLAGDDPQGADAPADRRDAGAAPAGPGGGPGGDDGADLSPTRAPGG